MDALNNDLNTSMAITVLYDMLKADMSDATKAKLVESYDEVLCLGLLDAKKEESGVDAEFEKYILEKIEERKNAKKEKDFAKADAIRNELLEQGIELKDTREGVVWKKI
jgi:cysteinyl-tRNA synthetase